MSQILFAKNQWVSVLMSSWHSIQVETNEGHLPVQLDTDNWVCFDVLQNPMTLAVIAVISKSVVRFMTFLAPLEQLKTVSGGLKQAQGAARRWDWPGKAAAPCLHSAFDWDPRTLDTTSNSWVAGCS